MSVYEFELVASGVLDDHSIDALFEAGCGDATFGDDNGVVTAMFAREASTLTEAVMSAIAAVEAVLGRGSVMRVEPDELVWAAEIAHRLGRARQSVGLLIDGKRGPGDFPKPAAAATRNPLWRWSEGPTGSSAVKASRWPIRSARRSSAPSTGRSKPAATSEAGPTGD